MSRRGAVAGLASIALSLACFLGGHPPSLAERARYRERAAVESLALARTPDTTYQRRMYDFIRRSMLVSTDSLAQLFVALGTAPDSAKRSLLQASVCEEYYLIRKYGAAPFLRAQTRVIDSLAGQGIDVDRNVERAFSQPGPHLQMDPSNGCNSATRVLPQLPDSIRHAPVRSRPLLQ